MGSRARTSAQLQPTTKSSPSGHAERMENPGAKIFGPQKTTTSRRRLNREKKLALLQDVDKLKKKLRHEENVHRALERALTRPLGALPRLPPYLPPYTLELLAEVALLEEEIVRLEEQVVNFLQDLCQEAAYISSKRKTDSTSDSMDDLLVRKARHERSKSLSQSEFSSLASASRIQPSLMRSTSCRKILNEKSVLKKSDSPPPIPEGIREKENCSSANSAKNGHNLKKISPKSVTPVKRTPAKKECSSESPSNPLKLKLENRFVDHEMAHESPLNSEDQPWKGDNFTPNKISGEMVRYLSSIFLRMSTEEGKAQGPEDSPAEPHSWDCYNTSPGTLL
ncbi:hypothetical protein SAY86_018258 [Trapa natans]|uniref:Ternary complex factor MIP1 leucine-zipper domain-containing protein n=1 Tax=Trapa natans TaxID=22666 RepID=A0AAN7R0U3_TRANT|nr:hypothetical protein SAY86_018258 [Trapa natans]